MYNAVAEKQHRLVSVLLRWTTSIALCLGVFVSQSDAEVEGDWVDFRKLGPIFVRAEFRLNRYDDMLDTIKQQQADVSATLGLKNTNRQIIINLFATKRSYLRFMAANEPLGVKRQALFIQDGDVGNVYVYRHFSFETDLRHEVTHAMLHSILPFIPLWLDEGLAEYFEVRATKRASSNCHQSRLKWATRFGWKPNLKALESKDEAVDFTAADYRESWAWVHFMLHGPPEANRLLKGYLQAIQQQRPPGNMSVYINHMYDAPAEKLTTHLKRWK